MSGVVCNYGLVHELLLAIVAVGLDVFAREINMEVSSLGQSFYR